MGANNPRDPRNPRNIPDVRRPQEWRSKRDVPPAVVAIYVVMMILILAICGIVFAVTLKNSEDPSVPYPSYIPGPAASPGSSGGSGTPQSGVSQSVVSQSSTESSGEWTSQTSQTSRTSTTSSDWTVIRSSQVSGFTSSDGSGYVVYATDYSKDFFKNSLFIGDSIFTGLSGYGFLDAENVAAKIGYTPAAAMNKPFDAKGSITAVEYAKQFQPDRIYLMLGSNTMDSRNDFSVIVSQYHGLVLKLQQECPDSKICVISIPPVTEDSSSAKAGNITNENIRKVNKMIEKMADSRQVDYFDLNSFLSDENGFFREEFAEPDGLHFKGIAYKVMLSLLQHKLGSRAVRVVIDTIN